jgi:exosome complex component RRP41
MNEKPEHFIVDGKRLDGRSVDELRPIKIKLSPLDRADGSCYLEWGRNKIMAAVYGPRELHPRHRQNMTKAVVQYRYNMAAFSVDDRIRPGHSRRSIEISKVGRDAFEYVVFTKFFPKTAVDIFIEVLQADAGTRTAGINAASLALADAGIPMRGLVSACAVGKVDGEIVLDLMKEEDNFGDADVPIAMTAGGKITHLQMDGNLTKEEFYEALKLAKIGCDKVYKLQRQALIEKYNGEYVGNEEGATTQAQIGDADE